jgi:hypothetical protein
MSLLRLVSVAGLAALSLTAETIANVSRNSDIQLYTGDVLVFAISARNYQANAAGRKGVPLYPTELDFRFVSAPLTGAMQFTAELQSADGMFSVSLPGTLSFDPGYFRDSGYRGPASVLAGSFSFSESDSEGLFGSGAVLRLVNTGPAVTVGLSGHKLQQDMFVSLQGGRLSTGAVQESVGYIDAPRTLGVLPGGAPMDAPAAVPEPQSGALFMVGAAVVLVALLICRSPTARPRIK